MTNAQIIGVMMVFIGVAGSCAGSFLLGLNYGRRLGEVAATATSSGKCVSIDVRAPEELAADFMASAARLKTAGLQLAATTVGMEAAAARVRGLKHD